MKTDVWSGENDSGEELEVRLHHSSGYDGNVHLMVPEECVTSVGDVVQVSIPFAALKNFVANHVYFERLGALERMADDVDAILGIPDRPHQ
jgi:hypothetical protein